MHQGSEGIFIKTWRHSITLSRPLRIGSGRRPAPGRWKICIVELKLGENEVEMGANHLTKIEKLIKEHNETEKQVPLRLPDLKIILTGTKYGYRREDGVFVIPIGCLRD